jgi:hypothetical protein
MFFEHVKWVNRIPIRLGDKKEFYFEFIAFETKKLNKEIKIRIYVWETGKRNVEIAN